MVLSVVLAITAAAAAATPGKEPSPCCFTHPGYVGVCSVVPAEKESCADILAYLNNFHSVGKTYCNNTRIRTNWTNVPCPPAKPAPASSQAASPETGRVRPRDAATESAQPR
jgi:hypothetical protein